jgi:hypothetical protein
MAKEKESKRIEMAASKNQWRHNVSSISVNNISCTPRVSRKMSRALARRAAHGA